MSLPEQSILLRVFIGEADEVDGRPLYEAIVTRAREFQMAGATVLRGPLGFGRSSLLHTAKILRLSQDLPVVIEIVDAEDKIGAFISEIMVLTKSCLITTEKVRIIRYGEGEGCASMTMGVVGFFAPYVAVPVYAHYGSMSARLMLRRHPPASSAAAAARR